MKRRESRNHRSLVVERLERRVVLAPVAATGAGADALEPELLQSHLGDGGAVPVMQSGLRFGFNADSPSRRVDPNTAESDFAAVGSLAITSEAGSARCTGSLISPEHVLTAAHCLDQDFDGTADENLSVQFQLNIGAGPLIRDAQSWVVHPDFDGFGQLSINDDVAVIQLVEPVQEVDPYELHDEILTPGTTLTMAGYGQSGDGLGSLFHFLGDPGSLGYYVDSEPDVKRSGKNNADLFLPDDERTDEGPLRDEVFVFDFDGPRRHGWLAGPGPLGGRSLGNRIETQLGFGDSGSSSFVEVVEGGSKVLKIAGVNTFVAGFPPSAFGALGGGMLISAYDDWIMGVVEGTFTGNDNVSLGTPAESSNAVLTNVINIARRNAEIAAWAPSSLQGLELDLALSENSGFAEESSSARAAGGDQTVERAADPVNGPPRTSQPLSGAADRRIERPTDLVLANWEALLDWPADVLVHRDLFEGLMPGRLDL